MAPSEEHFARTLMRKLLAAGDTRQAEYDADRFQLSFSQNNEAVGSANLQNLFDEYLSHSAMDRPEFLKSAVRSLLALHKEVPEDFESARHDLLVSVRNRTYFSLTEMQSWLEGNLDFAWPHSPVAEHLAMGLVYDLPEAMLMLQHEQLEQWGITYYQAVETALNNLAELEAAFASIDDLIYVSSTQDNYDASRLIVPDLIRELKIEGEPVVMVPNRDSLLITGSGCDEGLQLLANLGRDTLKQPRPMCGVTFRLEGDEWAPWLPKRQHPAYAALHGLYLESVRREYEEQHAVLQQWYDQSVHEVLVAEYGIVTQQRTRERSSYCIWVEGQEWALPVADRVYFATDAPPEPDRPPDAVSASWTDFQRLFSDYIREEDVYPPRYHVRGFPSPRQLSSIVSY